MIHVQNYKTSTIPFSKLIERIGYTQIEPAPRSTRKSESCRILNDFVDDKAFLPDVHITKDIVTTSNPAFNSILKNFLDSKYNCLYMDILSSEFKTKAKGADFPEYCITLNKTLNNVNWFILKEKMIKDNFDEDEVERLVNIASSKMQKLFDTCVVARINIKLKEKEFFAIK